jgi:hypothetical protein
MISHVRLFDIIQSSKLAVRTESFQKFSRPVRKLRCRMYGIPMFITLVKLAVWGVWDIGTKFLTFIILQCYIPEFCKYLRIFPRAIAFGLIFLLAYCRLRISTNGDRI